ncbi:MAG: KH domain protein [Promethearchaeota archaeon]|nr:MAG: KH domain protein [Candidatus Lokiarchaeota archaeon]
MISIFKLNKNRIAVVIGSNGETKREIEEEFGVVIEISSKTGNVEIKPNLEHENYEPLNVLTVKSIVQAINRGFNPDKAMKLQEKEYILEIFNLASILGKSEKKLKRIKGRIIGRNGEMRKAIERYAECYVSVYGKTVSIIADYENLQVARKALNMLITGMPHHTVLKFLENKYSEKQKERFKEMYKPEF